MVETELQEGCEKGGETELQEGCEKGGGLQLSRVENNTSN